MSARARICRCCQSDQVPTKKIRSSSKTSRRPPVPLPGCSNFGRLREHSDPANPKLLQHQKKSRCPRNACSRKKPHTTRILLSRLYAQQGREALSAKPQVVSVRQIGSNHFRSAVLRKVKKDHLAVGACVRGRVGVEVRPWVGACSDTNRDRKRLNKRKYTRLGGERVGGVEILTTRHPANRVRNDPACSCLGRSVPATGTHANTLMPRDHEDFVEGALDAKKGLLSQVAL